jgi:hypothetical protein
MVGSCDVLGAGLTVGVFEGNDVVGGVRVGFAVGRGTGAAVVGALVAGALVAETLVMGALVMGALVMGALVMGALVVGVVTGATAGGTTGVLGATTGVLGETTGVLGATTAVMVGPTTGACTGRLVLHEVGGTLDKSQIPCRIHASYAATSV